MPEKAVCDKEKDIREIIICGMSIDGKIYELQPEGMYSVVKTNLEEVGKIYTDPWEFHTATLVIPWSDTIIIRRAAKVRVFKDNDSGEWRVVVVNTQKEAMETARKASWKVIKKKWQKV